MKLKEDLRNIVVQALGTLLATMLLGLIAFIVPFSRDFVLKNLIEVIQFLLLLALAVFIGLRDKKLRSKITDLEIRLSNINPPSTSDSGSQDKKITVLEKKIGKAENDLYEIKRVHLLDTAKKHEALGQRGALLCRLDIIVMDVQKDWEWNLEDSLRELDDYVSKATSFPAEDVGSAIKILSTVKKDGFREHAQNILEKIKSKLK